MIIVRLNFFNVLYTRNAKHQRKTASITIKNLHEVTESLSFVKNICSNNNTNVRKETAIRDVDIPLLFLFRFHQLTVSSVQRLSFNYKSHVLNFCQGQTSLYSN